MRNLIFIVLLISVGITGAKANGKFEGELVVQFLPAETNVILQEPITFIDSKGERWPVPADFKTDGASVPRFAWVAFPPFAGLYIKAAVVHDHYCVSRDRPWRSVHRMFYEAMLAAGVESLQARTMYAAVYAFGPRWSMGAGDRSISNVSGIDQLRSNEQLEKWIKDTQPSVEEIDLYVNRNRIRQVPVVK